MKSRPLPYPDRSYTTATSALSPTKLQPAKPSPARLRALLRRVNSDDVRRLAGADTQMIDLKGRTAIPGLTDTHVHLVGKGTAEMELVDCRDFYVDVHSVADILQRLANAAASAPKGSWIVAHGSPMQDFRINDQRFPDRHDLDRAVPDHPLSISFGAHVTIGNTPRSPRQNHPRHAPILPAVTLSMTRKPASPPASCTSAPS